MKKEEQIRKLTWKYFWEQKIRELVLWPFLFIVVGIFAAKFLRWIETIAKDWGEPMMCDQLQGFWCWFGYGVLGYLALFIIVFVLFFMWILIEEFIEWNWERAKEKAEENLK